MENHSYDNYLGMLGRGDGFARGPDGKPTDACPDAAGMPVRAFHMANTCQLPKQPSQAWNATHAQWNNGKMDGFVRSDSGPVAMGYWTGADIPFYYGLAKTFPVCDRWFGSCMGQTYPNRRFLLAATARGNIDTDNSTLTDFQPPNGTIMELLNKHAITWRDYYTDLPTTALFLPVAQANGDKLVKIDRFFADAAAGTLPAFSLVEPNFDHASEENSDDITTGESFVSEVVDAVMKGPGWAKTFLVWTYDEHGGYYDHLAPPRAVPPDDVGPRLAAGDSPGGYDIYGFRVPAVVVSPYAKRNYVSASCTTTRRSSSCSRRSTTCRRSPTATPRPTRSSTASSSARHPPSQPHRRCPRRGTRARPRRSATRPVLCPTPTADRRARALKAGRTRTGRAAGIASSGVSSSSTVGPTRAAIGASTSRSNPYTAAVLPASTCWSSDGSVPANDRRRLSRV